MDNHPDQVARQKQLELCGTHSTMPIRDAAGTSTSFPLGMETWYGDAIRVQKLDPRATIPTQANTADAGYDLYALEDTDILGGEREVVRTGIAMAIPRSCVGLIWPRSGLAVNSGIDVFAGVVDSGYRGEIKICLYNSSPSCSPFQIKAGDRVAQILFQAVESFELYETKELDTTDRGCGGFGSSGA
tara:strand:+ start:3539 stop:4099 length:561 start_codon:yes stop_codon:yes gene_type:complete